jgi:hypothetical protein
MKRILISTLVMAAAILATPAFAEGTCNVPQAEWQPKEALQKKLEAEGWTVKTVKVDEGCYEVYGRDAAGKKMETYFNPKTFEVVDN